MIEDCIFLDINTQHEFFNSKGLKFIKDAAEIRPNLKKLTICALSRGIPLISSVETGEKYCVPGLTGYDKIPETEIKGAVLIPNINHKINYGCLLNTFPSIHLETTGFNLLSNRHSLALLKSLKRQNLIIYGVALDYGIEMDVVNLLKEGFKVWIPADAVKPINELNREPTMKELRKLGAEVWNTEFLMKNV